MTIITPERSVDQRMRALELANEVRSRRAELKREMKDGLVACWDVLPEPQDYLLTMKVFDLLLAQPKFGRVKVNKLLTQCKISSSKTVGGLSPRQRGELLALIGRTPSTRVHNRPRFAQTEAVGGAERGDLSPGVT
jgi:hypothetical protein